MSSNHDFSKREKVSQYPSWWVSSKPPRPKLMTTTYLPKLDLKYYNDETTYDENRLVNENTRAYIERMKKVVC